MFDGSKLVDNTEEQIKPTDGDSDLEVVLVVQPDCQGVWNPMTDPDDRWWVGEAPPVPAARFVESQAWWIASELARRNPGLRILESWPLDGHYHGLQVRGTSTDDHVFMNFLGRIHYHPTSFREELEPLPWIATFLMDSPHAAVKRIESSMRWTPVTSSPTTPRTLIYRTASALATARVNDRHPFSVGDSYSAGGFVDWPDLLTEFEGCRLALQKDTVAQPPPSTRVWVIRTDGLIPVLLSELGLMFRRDADPVDLFSVYRKRRRLDDVTAVVVEAVEHAA